MSIQTDTFNRILIEPITPINQFGLSDRFFEDVNGVNYLRLYLQDNQYQRLITGGSSELQPTSKGDFVKVDLFKAGFNFKVVYSEYELYQAFRTLEEFSKRTKRLVQIYDFVHIEPENYLSGVTLRKCLIYLNNISGAIKNDGKYKLPSGFSFRAIETDWRY